MKYICPFIEYFLELLLFQVHKNVRAQKDHRDNPVKSSLLILQMRKRGFREASDLLVSEKGAEHLLAWFPGLSLLHDSFRLPFIFSIYQ